IGLKKLRIQRKFPQVFDFLVSTKQEESAEVKEIIKQKVDPIYDESTNKMYEQIDYDKFREGIDIEKAIEILNRSEEHTSELQSRFDLVCRLLLEKKKKGKSQKQIEKRIK